MLKKGVPAGGGTVESARSATGRPWVAPQTWARKISETERIVQYIFFVLRSEPVHSFHFMKALVLNLQHDSLSFVPPMEATSGKNSTSHPGIADAELSRGDLFVPGHADINYLDPL